MAFAKGQELVELAMLATRRSGVTLAGIVAEFGCSHRTAQRMTGALESAFPAVEQSIDEDGRAHWTLPTRAVAPLLTPSAEELAALSASIGELERNGLTTEAATMRQLERKVRALIPPHAGTRLSVDEEALLEALGRAARPGPRPATNGMVDTAISEAIKGCLLLRIRYRRRHDDEARLRNVAPHGLLLGTRRYLVARDTSKAAGAPLQHYRVEEIYEAEVLDQGFEIDPRFSLRRHAERGFGSYESEAEFGEVVWRFRPDAAEHARRFIFHPTQSVTDLDDGSIEVRFEASGHLEMCWHLYSWGDAVEVLAPEALRKMVERYRRSDFAALP